MKKAFTLVEMLIVVVVLVTLMTITFRLGSIGQSQGMRARTISKLQRVENCLSGYFAAFGSYPPVAIQGSRNINLKVNSRGFQQLNQDQEPEWSNESRAWLQVEAACRSQPVGCSYPPDSKMDHYIEACSREIQKRASSNEEKYKAYWQNDDVRARNVAGFSSITRGNLGQVLAENSSDWSQVQIFKFGLMSFLLPRYLLMMNFDRNYGNELLSHPQWTKNNNLPCDPLTGRKFSGWTSVKNCADDYRSNPRDRQNLARVANIPSQAVCARWMPNLQGICSCTFSTSLFGINIKGTHGEDYGMVGIEPNLEICSPDPTGTSDQYVLDGVTVRDGWGNELFYYSPPPYQSYTLWSAGPNGKTFPPWIDRKEFVKENANARELVAKWIADDIIQLSN